MRPIWASPGRAALAWALLAIAPAASGSERCAAPTAPASTERPVKPPLPVKPACLDAKAPAVKDACPGWEAYSYNDRVKAYNVAASAYGTAATAYVAKLNAYVAASAAFAKCEADSLR